MRFLPPALRNSPRPGRGGRAAAGTLLGSLVLGSHGAHAQAAPGWQVSVGLGGLYGGYQINHSDEKMDRPAPGLWVGVERERLGLLVGGAYYAPGAFVNGGMYSTYTPRRTRYYVNTSEDRSLLFPVLLRYGLRPGTPRLQVDASLGLLLTSTHRQYSSLTTDSVQNVIYSSGSTQRITDSGVLLGLGARCRVAGGLWLTADGLATVYRRAYLPAVLPLLTAGLRYQWRWRQ